MPIDPSKHHRSSQQLESGLDLILQSPKDGGRLELIVARPAVDERMVLLTAELDIHVGLKGDIWNTTPFWGNKTGLPHPDTQITIMNSRAIALVAGDRSRWALAGDQLYIDLDLSDENLPPGSRLQIGSAILKVTREPHTGCKKFAHRYGLDAMKFVNSTAGRQWNLRGINATVEQSGEIKVGDSAIKFK